jgi:hypothetical protein
MNLTRVATDPLAQRADVTPRPFTRRARCPLVHLALVLSMTWLAGACRPAAREAVDAELSLTLRPSPPTVGSANVTLTLAQPDGRPLQGATVRLEGNMNHAGMVPTFADLRPTRPGTYTGTLPFTMGGDWFVLATVTMPDGRRMERRIDVPGVQAR